MHTTQGVRVFRSGPGDEPTVVAYAFRDGSYIAFIYRKRRGHVLRLAFSELLDIVPVRSMMLAIPLAFEETIDATISTWIADITAHLERMNSGGMSSRLNFNARSPPRRMNDSSELPSL